MKFFIQIIILFFGSLSIAAIDLQPEIVLDSDSVLDQPRDGKVFYQTNKQVSFFDLATKKTVTGSCDLDTAKKYQSRVSVLDKGIFLVYRMVNASPSQYRLFLENGNCWSIYEGYNFNFITKDPESGLWIAGLDNSLVFIDVKVGKIVNSVYLYQGPFPAGSFLTKVIDNQLFIFSGKYWPSWDSVRVFDLKAMKETDSNYFKFPLIYGFKYESELFFHDYSNNFYKFDGKNVENSFSQSEFALHKECTWFDFYKKDKMFLCQQTSGWHYVFSLQQMGSSEVIYPWGKEGGDLAIYSAERNLALKTKGSDLYVHNLLNKNTTTLKTDGTVLGLLTSATGEPYFGTTGGLHTLDSQGNLIHLYKFTGFDTDDYLTDSYTITESNLIIYRVPNYEAGKEAIYSVKVK